MGCRRGTGQLEELQTFASFKYRVDSPEHGVLDPTAAKFARVVGWRRCDGTQV